MPSAWEADDGSIEQMVRFSASFFDAFLESQLNAELTPEFSLLCAASYYLADSVGSAVVVARRSEAPPIELGHGLARVAWHILRGDTGPINGGSQHTGFGNRLLNALTRHFSLEADAEEEIRAMCAELRASVYDNGSAREVVYADIVTALCSRKLENAARTILPPSSDLPLASWTEAMRKPRFPKELWPAQRKIAEAGLLRGGSGVVQMPTSAGKTRATELIIRSVFLSGRSNLAVIVAPFRSLCHDIRSDLAGAFADENIALDEVSDSFLLDIDIEGVLAQRSVLIVTPEKMLYMLRRAPELAERIGLIIYDEGHQFEGFARGPTYELLLSSLRMTLAPAAQVVLISAVIGNAPVIAEWLIGDENAVISGEGLLPTTKSIAFASWQRERGLLQYVSPDDPEQQEFFVPRIVTQTNLALKPSERTARVFPERGGAGESGEVGLFLGLHLVERGSVALFRGTKEGVISLCGRAAEIFDRAVALPRPLDVSDAAEIARLTHLASLNLGADQDVTQASALGILAHHGNTPEGLRLAVEHAMKEGHAKFVICTSTLAQGVNFPIRYLIVSATQQGKEKIKVRDFQNLIGRAGRAGMHTEGSVIFSAPSIYDQRGNWAGRWRWVSAKNLLDPARAEPSHSSILDLFEEYEQPPTRKLPLPIDWLDLAFATHADIDAVVASVKERFGWVDVDMFKTFVAGRARAIQSIAAYLAAYVDFTSDQAGERIDELAHNTLAWHLADDATRGNLLEVFRMTARAIEAAGDDALRALIRKSPLPPADVFSLRDWTNANIQTLVDAAERGELVDTVYAEVHQYVTSKALSKLTDQNHILPTLKAWLAGQSFNEIGQALRAADVRSGNRHITANHVVAICEGGFGFELAMVVASMADLVEPLDEDLYGELVLLQRQIKNGLSNAAALAFYEAGFKDRVVAQALAAVFEGVADRAGVRMMCRAKQDELVKVLGAFPAYFQTVAEELRH
ncbi:DEAD/DEAH box helicase [Roseibium alexandrii]|uniref:Ski2-like helicase n=1 Tax=Roseibium alexandrii TaxID=388408 RepID=A0A0M7A5I8_9HYPH|nr:DEAD/DEAH box helicase [Roseibium alexandrii]CTQ69510.1 ski2-like helicase [Roseibium alexandrii]